MAAGARAWHLLLELISPLTNHQNLKSSFHRIVVLHMTGLDGETSSGACDCLNKPHFIFNFYHPNYAIQHDTMYHMLASNLANLQRVGMI
jgi:hypothetical protein